MICVCGDVKDEHETPFGACDVEGCVCLGFEQDDEAQDSE